MLPEINYISGEYTDSNHECVSERAHGTYLDDSAVIFGHFRYPDNYWYGNSYPSDFLCAAKSINLNDQLLAIEDCSGFSLSTMFDDLVYTINPIWFNWPYKHYAPDIFRF